MAVIKEWRCLSHGPFDGHEGVCPKGCTTVIREFRTAPAGKSARTKASDAALEGLAAKYGLTDMSTRNGSVGASRKQDNSMMPVWGKIPTEGNVDAAMQTLGVGRENPALTEMERAQGALPTFMDIKKALPQIRPQVGKGMSFGNSAMLDAAIKRDK